MVVMPRAFRLPNGPVMNRSSPHLRPRRRLPMQGYSNPNAAISAGSYRLRPPNTTGERPVPFDEDQWAVPLGASRAS